MSKLTDELENWDGVYPIEPIPASDFDTTFSLTEKDFWSKEMVENAKGQVKTLKKYIDTLETYIKHNKDAIKVIDVIIKNLQDLKADAKLQNDVGVANIRVLEKVIEHVEDCTYKFS